MPVTPSPRRRAQMLQVHALRSRGFTIEQISQETNQAASTVHTQLRDFEFQREHIVAALAQDQLLLLLHNQSELLRLNELNPPQSAEHADSRNRQLQTLTALARELRLVCAVLLRAKHDHVFQYEQPQDLELSAEEFDAIEPLAQIQSVLANLLDPPPTDGEKSESDRMESNESGAIEPNLEISECEETQNPVHNGKSDESVEKHANRAARRRDRRAATQTEPTRSSPKPHSELYWPDQLDRLPPDARALITRHDADRSRPRSRESNRL